MAAPKPPAPPKPLASDIVFDGAPSNGAPPGTLGPFTMTPFGPDDRPAFGVVSNVPDPAGTIGFSPSLEHRRIGTGWGTWSHGYGGDVYWTQTGQSVTLTMPPDTEAFYFYAEPEHFALFNVTASAEDGTSSGPVSVNGDGGAKYFGFYGTNGALVSSIVVSSNDTFAVGEFGIKIKLPPPPPPPVEGDLALAKSGPELVREGETYTYHLAVSNAGPALATNVSVTDSLPANTTFVSASVGCTQAAGVVTCTIASLANGDSMTLDVTVLAGRVGSSIVNTATASGDQPDPNPADNSSTVTTTLSHPLDCTGVTGGPDLWPPNHEMRPIVLTGATDPGGAPLTWTVTGVTQDEPPNGLGDGDTAPDAQLLSGNMLQLRAERAGAGDGRVYRIAFSVSNGRGGRCDGVAVVGVPQEQGGAAPVDSGPVFSSL